MKLLWSTVVITALLTAACASIDKSEIISTGERYDVAYASQPYVLGAGDMLHILVYGETQITGDYLIGPDGAVDLPLIGKVDASGKTIADITAEARSRYGAGYLRAPSVSIQIKTYRPVYVLGEVGMPGKYDFEPGMTAAGAIASARGYSPRANKRVLFIRSEGSDTEQVFEVTPTLQIHPGDTIRVGERYF